MPPFALMNKGAKRRSVKSVKSLVLSLTLYVGV